MRRTDKPKAPNKKPKTLKNKKSLSQFEYKGEFKSLASSLKKPNLYVKAKKAKQPNATNWFLKYGSKERVEMEVLASQIFQFYIPTQPKVRRVKDKETKQYLAASKDVDVGLEIMTLDFKHLEKLILSREITNLGYICIYSLLTEENDLKFGNLIIQKNPDERRRTAFRFVKIDGGEAFIEILKNDKSYNFGTITPEIIANLPRLSGLSVNNWLDEISGSKPGPQPYDKTRINKDKHFRREVHEAIFKLYLTPDDVFKKLIAANISDSWLSETLLELLLDRKFEIVDAVENDMDYYKFLYSSDAVLILDQFIEESSKFKIDKEPLLSNEDITELNDIKSTFLQNREHNINDELHALINSIDTPEFDVELYNLTLRELGIEHLLNIYSYVPKLEPAIWVALNYKPEANPSILRNLLEYEIGHDLLKNFLIKYPDQAMNLLTKITYDNPSTKVKVLKALRSKLPEGPLTTGVDRILEQATKTRNDAFFQLAQKSLQTAAKTSKKPLP